MTPADVARVRAATAERKTFWKVDELVGVAAGAARGAADVEGTASHNSAAAPGAFTFASWTTATPQQPGMWFQIELP